MRVERGLEAGGLRLRLTIASEDVTSHSVMSDNEKAFNVFANEVSDVGRDLLQTLASSLGSKALQPKERE